MVPVGRSCRLDALPLTANGKVDRQALPAPGCAAASAAALTAPRTPPEELLAGIWRRGAGRRPRSASHDDFFELGGHSLLATAWCRAVREALGVELPLRALFEAPDASAGLARGDRGGAAERGRALRRLRRWCRAERERRRRSRSPRSGSGSSTSSSPAAPPTTCRAALRLRGPLSMPALSSGASPRSSRRHEALRTTLRRGAAASRCRSIAAGRRVPPAAGRPRGARRGGTREDEPARLARPRPAGPFDLGRGPLLRGAPAAARRGASTSLLVDLHHIATDGWSHRRPGPRDLRRSTRRSRRGPAVAAAGAAGPVRRLRGLAARAGSRARRCDAQLAYWRERLAGAPARARAADRPAAAAGRRRSRRRDSRCRRSPAAAARRLRRSPRDDGRHAVHDRCSRPSGAAPPLRRPGRPAASARRSPTATAAEIEGLIGFFVNTLVLRADLPAAPTFRELLAAVRERRRSTPTRTRTCRSSGWSRSCSPRATSRRIAAVPGHVRAPERSPAARCELPGLDAARRWRLTRDHREVRPDALRSTEDGGGLSSGCGVQRRPVRRRDDRPPGRRTSQPARAALAGDPDARSPTCRCSRPAERAPAALRVERRRGGGAGRAPRSTSCLRAGASGRPTAVAAARPASALHLRRARPPRRDRARRAACRGAGVGPGVLVALLAPRSVDCPGRDARRPEGRRRLSAARPAPSRRRAWPGARQIAATLVVVAADSPACWTSRCGCRPRACRCRARSISPRPVGDDAAATTALDPSARRPEPDLAYVDLHLGLDRHAQGGDGRAPRHAQPPAAPRSRTSALTAADVVAQTALAVLRHLGLAVPGGARWSAAGSRSSPTTIAHDPARLLAAVRAPAASPSWRPCRRCCALLVETGGRTPAAAAGLAALRWLIPTGEALPPELCRALAAAPIPGVPLLNAYGPTECSDDVTHHRIVRAPAAEDALRCRSAGRWPTPRLYVLDRGCRPRAARRAGRALRRRRGVGRGYLDEPARTAEVFVPDPVRGRARARGSTAPATWRAGCPTATLRVPRPHRPPGQDPRLPHRAGRDRGGARRHPGRRATAAVLARADAPGASRGLVAYVVLRGGAGALGASCARPAARQLPEYMVPAAFVVLDGAAADRQRQGRPQGAARAGTARAGCGELRGAARRRSRSCWPRSGPRCWASTARRRRTTTSSSSAATRCSRPSVVSRVREAARRRAAAARRCSRRRPWPRSLLRSSRRRWSRGAGRRPRSRRSTRGRADRRCRCRSPRSGSGSSSSSSPAAPPTTSPSCAARSTGALDVAALARERSTRSSAATRCCAPRFARRRRAGRCRSIAPPLGVCRPTVDLSRPAGRGAREPRPSALRADEAAPRRSTSRAGRSLRALPASGSAERHIADRRAAPHRRPTAGRWRPRPRAGGALRRLHAGRAGAAARAAGPVRRLRALAARAGCRARRSTRQLAYWRAAARRRAAAARAAAPTGRARRCRAPRRRERVRRLRAPLADALRALGRRDGATLFMTLLAAFQALLARDAGQDRHRGRHADRQPQPARDRGADRLLRQHARRCAPTCRATRPSASCSRGCATTARRLRPPGRAVRAAGRGAAAGARPRASPLFQVHARDQTRRPSRWRRRCPA